MKPCACLFIRNCANGDNSNLALRHIYECPARYPLRSEIRGAYSNVGMHRIVSARCSEFAEQLSACAQHTGSSRLGFCFPGTAFPQRDRSTELTAPRNNPTAWRSKAKRAE